MLRTDCSIYHKYTLKNNYTETPINYTQTIPKLFDFKTQISYNNIMQCTMQTCANKHNWPAQLAVTECSGCHTPVLALRMIQCPYCNEPAISTHIRVDHIAGTHPITKKCQKELHVGPEYIAFEIHHAHTNWIKGEKSPAMQTIIAVPTRLEAPSSNGNAENSQSNLAGCVPEICD